MSSRKPPKPKLPPREAELRPITRMPGVGVAVPAPPAAPRRHAVNELTAPTTTRPLTAKERARNFRMGGFL